MAGRGDEMELSEVTEHLSVLSTGYFTVIKGNENEIISLLGETPLSAPPPTRKHSKFAARERTVVFMNRLIDFLSDGQRTVSFSNGRNYLAIRLLEWFRTCVEEGEGKGAEKLDLGKARRLSRSSRELEPVTGERIEL